MSALIDEPQIIDPVAVVVAPPPERSRGARIAIGVARGVITFALVIGAWVAFLKVFHVSHFIGKNPIDVVRYLTTVPGAAANRSSMVHLSVVTLRDAALGLLGGTVAAIACSVAFALWRLAAAAFMPMAMVLRSVPLVAMTPLIVGVFGRNLKAIIIIGGIVTFFPTLVNVTLALRRTPQEALDLCRAFGAGSAVTLWKVQVPSALPSLFASLRIAAPLSLVGALLAEFLATGQGLGFMILNASAVSNYDGLWTGVVLVTIYSALLYTLVGLIEGRVLHRFGVVTS